MIKRAFLFILVFSLFFIFYSYNVEAGEDITSWGDHNYTGDGGSVPDAAGDPMDAFTELKNPLAGSDGEVTFEVIVRRVVQATLGLTGVLAIIAFIYGGVLWMVSRGDTGMIQKGKTMMIWAVLGIVIIFSSYAIIRFIFEALMGTGVSTAS
ncbi:MAG TPA: pilin [bacterium]|nr:pilin [bacterium]